MAGPLLGAAGGWLFTFPLGTPLLEFLSEVSGRANPRQGGCSEARLYMGLDLLAKARLHPIESEADDTTLATQLTA
ncbi:hypothetical protein [Streptomyces siamensis]|uniref:Uncharacterized protein n=1 Tax=Streptomyces siamensis TaxID=1274986 RepID=A0ABP9JJY1_9ACTN